MPIAETRGQTGWLDLGSCGILCVEETDLTKSLHAAWRYLDNSLYTNEELNLMKAEDPFWAINKDYYEALRNQISELWNPGQFLDDCGEMAF